MPLRPRSVIPDEVAAAPDAAEIILAKLRGMIAAGNQEWDTILGTIAVAAHALTGASGAAIAMPRDGTVICVGRSGDIAPELGDRLNVDSGISGECLRTGRILRCDDASRDFQVDPDVCRQMNLQSLAVVPLRGQRGRVGVLEAFSTRSYAFTDEQMEILGRLAGLAEAAWAHGFAVHGVESEPVETIQTEEELEIEELETEEERQAGEVPPEFPSAAAPSLSETLLEKTELAGAAAGDDSIALTRVGVALATGLHAELEAERRWRNAAVAGLAIILLALLTILGWKAWYRASLPASTSQRAGSVEAVPAEPGSQIGEDASGPAVTVTRGSHRLPSIPKSSLSTEAVTAAAAPPDVVIRRQPRAQPAPDSSQEAASPANSQPDSVSAPEIPTNGGGTADLQSVLTASSPLPQLKGPISQGVAGGILVHKVMPIYPPEARRAHAQGMVILDATITERGQIEALKLVSGTPSLAEAAIEAVRQWRYTPYLLNGKPVRKQTRINITFIAP